MSTDSKNSTTRFSNRVEDYIRYRPGYPKQLMATLQAEAGLTPESIVADIGSGTGISADLFLRTGCHVFGVEPNREMRAAAEARFRDQPRFQSVDGTAEATTLNAQSVDLVASAQAFHWFNVERTRTEFSRILRPGGHVALFWNSRRTETTPFLQAYESLLQEFATDYKQVNHKTIEADTLKRFFGGAHYQTRTFPNSQSFDYAGLKGRLMSSSYAPATGHTSHQPMLNQLERIFGEHATDGSVQFEYDTELFFGQLVSP